MQYLRSWLAIRFEILDSSWLYSSESINSCNLAYFKISLQVIKVSFYVLTKIRTGLLLLYLFIRGYNL